MCWKPLLVTVVAWHLIACGVIAVCPSTIGRLILRLYTARFGDIQASYGTFCRLVEYVGVTVVTTVATALSLLLFERIQGLRVSWMSRIPIFLAWQIAAASALIFSYEAGIAYRLNQWSWRVFGPPQEIYSFRNLVLPEIIAWQLATTPVAIIALWLYGRLARLR